VLSRFLRLTAKLLIGTFLLLIYGAVLAVGACSIAGFFGDHNRYFELSSHFRLVYFLGLLACCVLLAVMRRWKGLAFSSVFLIMNLIPIAVLYFEGGPEAVAQQSNVSQSTISQLNSGQSGVQLPNTQQSNTRQANANSHTTNTEVPSTRELKVVQINVWAVKNKHYSDSIKVIRKHDPDVVGIVELSRDWKRKLAKELKDYPYVAVEERFGGLAIYSRYPLEGTQVLSSGNIERPRIKTTLLLPEQKVTLILAHVARPKRNYTIRNLDFKAVTAEAASAPRPMILFGDLNCTPWSAYFQKLLAQGKLRDSENGFGVQPTWSPRGWVPFVPIDHFLTSLDVKTVHREVGPDVGSDHLPVFVKLRIPVSKSDTKKAAAPSRAKISSLGSAN
jgi:Uncharacterized protein conserved in bacteria